MSTHEKWMRIALSLAETAASYDEVPVGAIIVKNQKIISSGFNQRERRGDPLSHAEIHAIQRATTSLGSWRLSDCTLYVTLEPCIMCAGAIHQARIDHVVFGAKDPKAGAMGSLYEIHADERLNHRLPVTGGVLESEAATLLKEFFRRKRK